MDYVVYRVDWFGMRLIGGFYMDKPDDAQASLRCREKLGDWEFILQKAPDGPFLHKWRTQLFSRN